MKKLLLILVLIIVLSSCGNIDQSPLGPKAKNNEEVMEYVQVLKKDFPLIKDRLEILRNGEIGKGGYTLHKSDENDDIYMYIYENVSTIDDWSPLNENKFSLPSKEIEVIEYLFLSEDLKTKTEYIEYGTSNWNKAIGSQGAMFAGVKNGSFNIGIFYFENNEVPEELQNSKDYVEELSDNYWIVACNMQRP